MEKDPWQIKRDEDGVLARSYYKLKEIDEKFFLIGKNQWVLDLGAAPGGWTQYIITKTKNVIAVDINDNFYVSNVIFYQKDIMQPLELDYKFDLIVSDIAPNTTGNKFLDCGRSLDLCQRVFEICQELKVKKLVFKIFEGSETKNLNNNLKTYFQNVSIFKPKSSKSVSKEIYFICK
jgi:23S rRNA (uridine2552-2'-O)-methyltransferase